MTGIAASPAVRFGAGRSVTAIALSALFLAAAAVTSLAVGPVAIAPARVIAILLHAADPAYSDAARDAADVVFGSHARHVVGAAALAVSTAFIICGKYLSMLVEHQSMDPARPALALRKWGTT